MGQARLTFIADLLSEHYDEIQFLRGQRQNILRSRDSTLRELRDLEERIESHVEGLLVTPEQVFPVVKDGLAAENAYTSFAAAYSLLRVGTPVAARLVIEAFQQAQEGQLEGVRSALCHGQTALVLDELQKACASASASIAVAAFEVLAFHGTMERGPKRLEQFLSDTKPEVRHRAWRINGLLSLALRQPLFEAGFSDKDAQVRREALWAAGWTSQPFLLPHCRSLAINPAPESWDGLLLLAILGKREDWEHVLSLGRNPDLGPRRFQLLGAYGNPESAEELIRAMQAPDLRSAVAAAAAFTKLTGCDIESQVRVQLPPEDGHEPDEFEKEFLDEAKLPDVHKARDHWNRMKSKFASSTRVCRGLDLSRAATPEILDQLDMESRWEGYLRARFEGSWQGTPMDLERFPQPKASVGT